MPLTRQTDPSLICSCIRANSDQPQGSFRAVSERPLRTKVYLKGGGGVRPSRGPHPSSTQKSVVQFSDAQAPVVQQIANSRVCCTTFSIKLSNRWGLLDSFPDLLDSFFPFVGQLPFVAQLSTVCWTVFRFVGQFVGRFLAVVQQFCCLLYNI